MSTVATQGTLNLQDVIDPMRLLEKCWPHVKIYEQQKAIVYSVRDNDETIVPAGNKLGKDFISAFIVLWYFLSRKQARIVTTSVDEGQLENVLWGEINGFIQSSQYALPLNVKHLDIRKVINGVECPKSYIIGRVAKKVEGLLGHHLKRGEMGEPQTLMVYDEASGIEDGYKEKTDTWAHRTLIIGNPFPCENFFKKGVKKGIIPSEDGSKRYVNIIKIKGQDSPNVRFAQAQENNGMPVTNQIIVPGVLTYDEYRKRRLLWDEVHQCISLDAEFYEGAEFLMYPPEWLNRAERLARYIKANNINRVAEAIGVDPAEGGDKTALSAVDRFGVIKLASVKTPDTSKIPHLILEFAESVGMNTASWEDCNSILIDIGGGGKQHADRLREWGHEVRTIAFGGAASSVDKYAQMRSVNSRIDEEETKQAYKNRRAEMYGILMHWLNPDGKMEDEGFALPEEYTELRRQLAPIPKLWDKEGRMYLPPKYKDDKNSKQRTLIEIIGRSPDEADATVLATFGMTERPTQSIAGVF